MTRIALAGHVFFLAAFGMALLSATFLVAVLSWENDWMDIDQAINDRYDIVPPVPFVGLFVSMVVGALTLSVIALTWNVIKLVRFSLRRHSGPSDDDTRCWERWCLGRGRVFVAVVAFWVVLLLVLVACVFGLSAFYGMYPILRDSFAMFVAYTLPLAQPALVLCLVLPVGFGLSALRRLWMSKEEGMWERRAVVVMYSAAYVALLILLLAVPIYLLQVSPNIVRPGAQLPPKPRFWAHRLGASWGPENTLCALNRTLDWFRQQKSAAERAQLFGVECDLRFSLDDVPFLLHDTTFLRTTNVRELFPTTPEEGPMIPGEMNYSDIRKLNAGSWFPERDPFGEVGSRWLSRADAETYLHGCHVPTFPEVLRVLATVPDLHIMWNVRGRMPKDGVQVLLQMVAEAYMNNRTLWLAGDNPEYRHAVQGNISAFCPGVRLSLGDDYLTNATYLRDAFEHGFEFVNSPMQLPASRFRNNIPRNMTRIVYDLNVPWIFSQLWLQGTAELIASNVFQRFLDVTEPASWTMASSSYIAMTVIVAAIALAFVALSLWFSARRWRQE
jgi:glycerophosphoryl diester phosphodiesterase